MSIEYLYNLTYQGMQYVSTRKPDNLPDSNYSLIEVTYNSNIIIRVKSLINYHGKKTELQLNDLEVMHYFPKIENISIEKNFEGVDQPEDKTEKMFLIYISSFLCYIEYIGQQSYLKSIDLSLDLLDNNAFDYFLKEKTEWSEEVSSLKKYFGFLFPSNYHFDKPEDVKKSENEFLKDETFKVVDETPKVVDEISKVVEESSKVADEIPKVVDENHTDTKVKKYIKKYVKKYIKEYLKEEIKKELDSSLKIINDEADLIAKEMKEYKKRMIQK